MPPNNTDDSLIPSQNMSSLNDLPEPAETGVEHPVPADLAQMGSDTNTPQADSPESLDQEITEGANRENIDPHHSIDRPVIDNINEEEHGVS